jgi:REP element-mobilizing transposase RayT
MARANRHYGNVWHITHRCHKKEFLLKFGRDRRRWIEWLFEARKRYGLKVLNYIGTSNHVHLLVADDGDERTIPESIQLIAGKTGQEYNRRKNRSGSRGTLLTSLTKIPQRGPVSSDATSRGEGTFLLLFVGKRNLKQQFT